MMIVSRAMAAAVVLSCLMCGESAFALAEASVKMSDFKFELIDLDVHDGITPSISFVPGPARNEIVTDQWSTTSVRGSGSFAPVELHRSTDYAESHGVISGDGTFAEVAVSVSSRTGVSLFLGATAVGVWSGGGLEGPAKFLLSANTSAVFSAHYELSSRSTLDGTSWGPGGLISERAWAQYVLGGGLLDLSSRDTSAKLLGGPVYDWPPSVLVSYDFRLAQSGTEMAAPK